VSRPPIHVIIRAFLTYCDQVEELASTDLELAHKRFNYAMRLVEKHRERIGELGHDERMAILERLVFASTALKEAAS
jgi:hypothetical protein